MSGFISESWQKYQNQLKKEPDNKLFDSHVVNHTLPVNKHGDFFEMAQHFCPDEFKRVISIWKNIKGHPILDRDTAKWIKDRYGMNFSRSTAYYIMQACWLLKYFPDLQNKTIVEVGAGFGGLARTLLETEKNIKQYNIIDLNIMLDLAKKILGNRQNVSYYDTTKNPHQNFKKQNLFICTLCLSETTKEYLQYLTDNIWPLCDNFFVIDSQNQEYWSNKMLLDFFKKNNLLYITNQVSIRNQVCYVAKSI